MTLESNSDDGFSIIYEAMLKDDIDTVYEKVIEIIKIYNNNLRK
jgi:hypothetical protein